LIDRRLKENYWSVWKSGRQIARLLDPANRSFAKIVMKDLSEFVFGLEPRNGDLGNRMRAAVAWLLRAQDTTGNGGVAQGYFPCDGPSAWRPAYPETTGYIITSLLRYAARYGDGTARQRALEMAQWEIDIQLPDGATQGGTFHPSTNPTPCAFNTGMVLDGLCSAFESTHEEAFLNAARRAADYLISDMTDEGYFKTNGRFVEPGAIKTYNCLCAWGMYRLGLSASDHSYKSHAVRAVEAAIRQQRHNGWFANNCLTRSDAPLLHTIAYTLQGILEVGILAGRDDFVEAARLGVAPLLARMEPNGLLRGRYYPDWGPACFSSCLTGSAQLAVICFRLFQHAGDDVYRKSADRLVNFLTPLQRLNSGCRDIDGALPGSFPIFGEYMPAAYPNWATKYYLDALMLQSEPDSPATSRINPAVSSIRAEV
jgi:uncharacterized protein YyaL (SSP411 family)